MFVGKEISKKSKSVPLPHLMRRMFMEDSLWLGHLQKTALIRDSVWPNLLHPSKRLGKERRRQSTYYTLFSTTNLICKMNGLDGKMTGHARHICTTRRDRHFPYYPRTVLSNSCFNWLPSKQWAEHYPLLCDIDWMGWIELVFVVIFISALFHLY